MKMHQVRRLVRATLPAILTFVVVLGTALAATAPAVVGDWQGALSTGNGSLRVVVHISQDKDGKLTATMDSPDQGATGIAISSITYQDPDLHFAIERFGCTYEGKMSKDKSEITGVWKQGAASLPLSFKRAGQ